MDLTIKEAYICKKLFLSAKHAGVDAVKLQKRDNKTFLLLKCIMNPTM